MTTPTQSQQDQRAQAAQTAAALYASSRAAQDSATAIGQIMSNYAAVTERSTEATTRLIANLWRTTNPYNDTEVSAFARKAGQLIVSAQKGVAATTAAAQVLQLQAVGINPKVNVTIPDNVRGAHATFGAQQVKVTRPAKTTLTYQSPEGENKQVVKAAESAPDRLFERAVDTYRFERSKGADHTAANDAAEQRIGDLVDANLMLAQRLAEQETLRQAAGQAPKSKKILGYRRVIHPELSTGGVCGLCVAASDMVYKTEDLKPIHHRCKCTVAAVTEKEEPGHRLNSADLNRLYTDAGEKVGKLLTSGPALKRPRYDLVHHHEMGPMLVRVKGEKVPYYTTAPAKAA